MTFENLKTILIVVISLWIVKLILKKKKDKEEGYTKERPKKYYGDFDQKFETQLKKHLNTLKIGGFDVDSREVQARAFAEVCRGEDSEGNILFPRPSKYSVYPWERVTKKDIENIYLRNTSLVKAIVEFEKFSGESEGLKQVKKYIKLIKEDNFEDMGQLNDLFKTYIYDIFKDFDTDRWSYIVSDPENKLGIWVDLLEAIEKHKKIIKLKNLIDEKSLFTQENVDITTMLRISKQAELKAST